MEGHVFGRETGSPPRAASRQIALTLLACNGIAAIWDLHIAAADAYAVGKREMAECFIEIAEAAEREWFTRCAAIADG
jgi:hypothetical protein